MKRLAQYYDILDMKPQIEYMESRIGSISITNISGIPQYKVCLLIDRLSYILSI